jgi:molecular chaperone GrpE
MKRKQTKKVDDSSSLVEPEIDESADPPSEMMLEVDDEEPTTVDIEEGEGGEVGLHPEVAEATAELALALEETRDQLLRARAEFDNYRKRVARDAERTRKLAAENILKDLLPVADNFERALDHAAGDPASLMEGVAMVYKQFADVLARHGLEPIPAVGEIFDPNVHEALSRMPSDEHAEDQVAQEYQKGYRLGDMVLRPAKVVISSGAPDGEA